MTFQYLVGVGGGGGNQPVATWVPEPCLVFIYILAAILS